MQWNTTKEFKSNMPEWEFFQKKKSEQMNTSNEKFQKTKAYFLSLLEQLMESTKLVEMTTFCRQSIKEITKSKEDKYESECTLNLKEFEERYLIYFDILTFEIILDLIKKFEEPQKKKENSQEEEGNLTLTTNPNEQKLKSKHKGKCILV